MTTVAEQYGRAISSSHLEVTTHKRGDIDVLIAAGMARQKASKRLDELVIDGAVQEGLATLLLRLQHDFDGADQKALRRGGWMESERLRFIVRLPSLKSAKAALDAFVIAQGRRQELDCTNDKLLWIAGKILDHFLDATCGECHGRREKEVPGSGRLSGVSCSACEGTGLRRLEFTGNTPYEEVLFVRSIQADIERKMDRINKLIGRYLREGDDA